MPGPPHLPGPPHQTMVESRPVPKDQPIGIPIYSTARGKSQKEPKFSLNEPQMVSPPPLNGTVPAQTGARRRTEPTYPLPPRSQFALGSNGNGAFRASGFGTNLRKTPQNIDLSPSTSGSPIFSDQMQQLTKSNGTSNDRLFQSQLKPNTNILLVGESQYYPRTTDRADV